MSLTPGVKYGPDGGGRLKNVTVVKPILVGCKSRRLPEPTLPLKPFEPWRKAFLPDDTAGGQEKLHTHEWVLYVRPYDNEDLSAWVKKIVFKIHDSYPDHQRVRTKPPYELRETGWGEFDVPIRMHVRDPSENEARKQHPSILTSRQVSMETTVRLLEHFSGDPSVFLSEDGWLVREYYDEVIFSEPTALMKGYLSARQDCCPRSIYGSSVDYRKKQSSLLESIRRARVLVDKECRKLQYHRSEFCNEYQSLKAAAAAEVFCPDQGLTSSSDSSPTAALVEADHLEGDEESDEVAPLPRNGQVALLRNRRSVSHNGDLPN